MMTPDDYLAVPYIMVCESFRAADGRWMRRARYPELPGCAGEAPGILEAIDRAEAARDQYILDRLARGEPVSVPRPPLKRGEPVSVPRPPLKRGEPVSVPRPPLKRGR